MKNLTVRVRTHGVENLSKNTIVCQTFVLFDKYYCHFELYLHVILNFVCTCTSKCSIKTKVVYLIKPCVQIINRVRSVLIQKPADFFFQILYGVFVQMFRQTQPCPCSLFSTFQAPSSSGMRGQKASADDLGWTVAESINKLIGLTVMLVLARKWSNYLAQLHDNQYWFTNIKVHKTGSNYGKLRWCQFGAYFDKHKD